VYFEVEADALSVIRELMGKQNVSAALSEVPMTHRMGFCSESEMPTKISTIYVNIYGRIKSKIFQNC
jgi:hypothetical protein